MTRKQFTPNQEIRYTDESDSEKAFRETGHKMIVIWSDEVRTQFYVTGFRIPPTYVSNTKDLRTA